MLRLRWNVALAGALLLLSLADAASALQRTAVFGRDGEVFKIRTDTYGALFPQGLDAAPEASVLALEVARPGQRLVRLLVPETAGAEVDTEPSLVYEDASRSLYVVWAQRELGGLAKINLASWDGNKWSDVIAVSAAPSPLKGRPQVAVTRLPYQPDPQGPVRQITVLYLVWWEETPVGEATYFSPVVLEDGVYLGWNPVFRLNDLDRSSWDDDSDVARRALFRAPAIEAGRDSTSVVIGFANARTARLVSYEFVALPIELMQLANEVRAHIIGHLSLGLEPLIEDVRAHIIGHLDMAHPAVLSFVAEQVASRLRIAAPSTFDPARLADDVRASLIVAGAEALLGSRSGGNASGELRIIEMPNSSGSGLPGHLVALRAVATHRMPAVGADDVSLRLSPDGRDAMVTWWSGGRLHYRETLGTGWSDAIRPTFPRQLGEDPERLLGDRLLD
jgi:hypothetical protein